MSTTGTAAWNGTHQRIYDTIRAELEGVIEHAGRYLNTREGAQMVEIVGPDGGTHRESLSILTLWTEPYAAVNTMRAKAGLAPVDEFTVRRVEGTSTGTDYRTKYALRLADLVIDGDPRFPSLR